MNRRLTRSDDLHEAVQRFAAGDSTHSFDELARAIAEFQGEFSAGYARLLGSVKLPTSSVDHLPGVPSDAFRLTRVAIHPEAEDVVRYLTSGTTGAGHGTHAMRRVDTYRALALRFGRAALLTEPAPRSVVALATRPNEPSTSSLGHMMAMFMVDFEAPLAVDVNDPKRWLLDEQGIDVAGLERAGRAAIEAGSQLIVLATSFALVSLLDTLGGRKLTVPARTTIMQTGGFKGISREVEPLELRRALSETFNIAQSCIVSEYGMTELTSQLYEGTLKGSALNASHNGAPGIYFEPPWLRVIPVDPVSLEPVPLGEVGIARFVDLGNVDSAIAVQTVDRVRRRDGGIELLGRAPGAPARGCSLAVEEFLAARAR